MHRLPDQLRDRFHFIRYRLGKVLVAVGGETYRGWVCWLSRPCRLQMVVFELEDVKLGFDSRGQ